MTNRKIKDYRKNKLLHTILIENMRNLFRILLTLNRLFPKQFYPKQIQEWLTSYAENCRETDRYEELEIYDYKMEQWCEEYGISEDFCKEFVRRNNPIVTNPDNILVLANNVKLALVHCCADFGIGDKRLAELVAALREPQPERPEEEMDRLHIETEWVGIGEVDYRKLLPKKQKQASYDDLKRGYEGLTALKAYQDEVINDGHDT